MFGVSFCEGLEVWICPQLLTLLRDQDQRGQWVSWKKDYHIHQIVQHLQRHQIKTLKHSRHTVKTEECLKNQTTGFSRTKLLRQILSWEQIGRRSSIITTNRWTCRCLSVEQRLNTVKDRLGGMCTFSAPGGKYWHVSGQCESAEKPAAELRESDWVRSSQTLQQLLLWWWWGGYRECFHSTHVHHPPSQDSTACPGYLLQNTFHILYSFHCCSSSRINEFMNYFLFSNHFQTWIPIASFPSVIKYVFESLLLLNNNNVIWRPKYYLTALMCCLICCWHDFRIIRSCWTLTVFFCLVKSVVDAFSFNN